MRFSPTRVAQARSARLLHCHRLLAGALGVLVGLVSRAVDPVHRGRGASKIQTGGTIQL